MSYSSESFQRYAIAEKELCDSAGPVVIRFIEDIEARHGIRIAEVRVSIDRNSFDGTPRASCTFVREAAIQPGLDAMLNAIPDTVYSLWNRPEYLEHSTGSPGRADAARAALAADRGAAE